MSPMSGRMATLVRRGSCSRSGTGHRRELRRDGRRGRAAGLWRFPCRRRLAARRRRWRARGRSLRLTSVCSAVSQTLRWGPRRFVCGFFANPPQIRSQGRHRDGHAMFREHRGDRRPAVPFERSAKIWGDSVRMVCCLLNSVAWCGGTLSSDCCNCRTVSAANLFLWSIASPVLSANTPFGRRAFDCGRTADAC